MKILQLCNKVPYPPKDGGAIAILNLSLAFVNQGHEVTLLAINTPKHSVTINQIPDSYSSKIKFKLIDVNTNINPLKMAYNLLFSTSPYIADRFISDDLRNSLIEILSAEIYDIVQVEGLYVTPYIDLIRKFSNARISYRAHNIEHVIWSRISKSEKNLLKKVYTRILARRLKRMEFKLINRYDLLVPITEKDSVFFKENGNSKPLYIVSGGIDEASFIISSSKKKPSSIFFIGALDWMPNQEGLVWFIDKVWTKLNNEDAALEFHVAGRNAPNWLINRLKESNIYFHGEIEDSHAFFDQYDIMVVPLFAGSGIRIKIIEAMARSKAIVTTSIGVEGIEAENGQHLIVADTPIDFLTGIIKLLENREFFTKLVKNSYNLAREKYSNSTITKQLTEFYCNNLL